MLWVDHIATRYHLTLGSSLSTYLDSGRNPIAGQWQHLAATFDGTTARFYIDGTQVASRAVSGSVGSSNTWRIGAYGSTARELLRRTDRRRPRLQPRSQRRRDPDRPEPACRCRRRDAPTTPGNLVVTGATSTSVSLQWDPSTDDVGVTGYGVYVNGASVATTGTTSFTFTDLSCGTSYQFGVEAFDADGNVSQRALKSSSPSCGTPTGLVAAYSFDEGAGGQLGDASGNGHVGTISGATWTAGHAAGALSFNGTNAHVSLGALGTFYQQGFTLEAWVRKQTATKNDVGVVGSWTGSGPMLWIDHIATRYHLTLGGSLSTYLDSGVNPIAGQWQHIAATSDGTTARFYIDGAEVASRAVSGSVGNSNTWRIGAYGSSPGGFFDGLIDDVRIYDRALSAAEIQIDLNQPVTVVSPPSDTTPPTAPGPLTATGAPGQASLTWGAATDNVGVAKYNLHRSTASGFAPTAANRIAQPTGTSYTDTGLAAGTYYYKVTAEDAAGNVSSASNEATATVPASDTTPPSVSITAPSAGTTVSGPIAASANAADQSGVAGVQFKRRRTEPRRRGHHRAVLGHVGHARRTQRRTHADRRRPRRAPATRRRPHRWSVTVNNAGVLGDRPARRRTASTRGRARPRPTRPGTTRPERSSTPWTAGHFGGAVSLNGTSAEVDPPALGTFYKTGFTYEAWVLQAVVQGRRRRRRHLGRSRPDDLGRPHHRPLPADARRHASATTSTPGARPPSASGSTSRRPTTARSRGSTSTASRWRARRSPATSATRTRGGIGAYDSSPCGFFDGLIDNVRIYDRALTASRDPDRPGVPDPARSDAADGDGEDARERRGRSSTSASPRRRRSASR